MEVLVDLYIWNVAYTDVETQEEARVRRYGRAPKPANSVSLSLWHLVVLGFVGSLGLVASLFYVFAAYTTQNFFPWERQPVLTAEEQSGILRNAVTAAAALGVGVTLLLTYRRQKTTEDNFLVTTGLLELQQRQHDVQIVSDLRERYALAAEQLGSDKLPLAIAGVHSIESLTDEWYEQKNEVERQNCVSLLTEFLKLSSRRTKKVPGIGPLIIQTLLGRLRKGLPEGRYWNLKVNMAYSAPQNVADLYLDDAILDLRGIKAIDNGDHETGLMSRWCVVSGEANLSDLDLSEGSLVFRDSSFEGGKVTLHMDEATNHGGQINFRNCLFSGTNFMNPFDSRDTVSLTFTDCVFRDGSFTFPTYQRPRSVSFLSCTFEKNIFAGSDEEDNGFGYTELFLKDCNFTEGVDPLVSRKAPEAPRRDFSSVLRNVLSTSEPE